MKAMATGGSDISTAVRCTQCSKNEKNVQAIKQCLDCNASFCEKCFEIHNKSLEMSEHTIYDKEDIELKGKVGSVSQDLLPEERCRSHHQERLTTYCEDHAVICCHICIAVDHRNCNGVNYILKASEGIQTSERFATSKTDLSTSLKEMKRIKTEYQNHLIVLDHDENTNIKHVRNFTEGLKKRLTELETMDIAKIQSRYKELREIVTEDTMSLDKMISAVEGSIETLNQCQSKHDSQVLVDVLKSQTHITDATQHINDLGSKTKPSVKYVISKDIEHYTNNLDSLGTFPDDQQYYEVELQGEYDIKTGKDKWTANCVGSCLLPDGTIVLGDWNNQCVKRLDRTYKVIDQCGLKGEAWGVACIGPTEVAVTLTNQRKVQFVTVRESMFLTRSFSTVSRCRGICFNNGELFVSCGGYWTFWVKEDPGYVAVYSQSGAHLRTIQTSPSGELIFSCPQHITASKDGTRVYISQNTGGVLSLDRNGVVLASFNDDGLKNAFGVCTLDNDHILVCDRISNNVFQLDSDCKKVGNMLTGNDGIKRPRSFCYISTSRRLIITFGNQNIIKVFNLK